MQRTFYFDLASPLAYLAAEQVLGLLEGPCEWQPVLARELPAGAARARAGGDAPDALRTAGCDRPDALRAEAERGARALGLQPLRWPDPFPFDSALAMRVATFAHSIGRAVPFAQAAFRQAFAGGHSLQDPDFVLIAAAACEMHPDAVTSAAAQRSVAERLAATTAAAAAAGVRDVPAVVIADDGAGAGGRVFAGERELEQAGRVLRE